MERNLAHRINSFLDYKIVENNSILFLEELVQCGLCLDEMKKPKMLSCQHTFCLECLQSLLTKQDVKQNEKYETQIQNIVCPLCKTDYPLENSLESLENLPSNIYVESLLSFIANYKNSNVKPDRFKRLCTNCKIPLQLEDIACQHCKLSFCQKCLGEHANQLLEKIPLLNSNLNEIQEKLDCRKEDFVRKSDQLKNKIHDCADFKILEIKSKEEEALEKLKEKEEKTLENSQNIIKKINDFKQAINNNKITGSNNDKIEHYLKFQKDILTILELVEKFAEFKFVFDKKVLTLDIIEEYNEEVNNFINNNTTLESLLSCDENVQKYYKTHNFVPKFIWNKCPRPSGIGIPPWSKKTQLYIATNENKTVIVLDRSINKVIGRLEYEKMRCPISLTFSEKRKEIYVVDKWAHCIHVFCSSGTYLRSMCSRGSSEGKLISPEGITISENDHLFVCDTGNNRIVELNPENGAQLNIIGRSKNTTDLDSPTGIAYFKEKIYVVDCGSNRVKVFGLNGEKAFEFGGTGTGKGEFRSPESISVDLKGNILIGDCGNVRIQVFAPSGEFLKMLGKSGDFQWVSDLIVTGDLEIIVADHKSKKVQIF